MKRQVFFSFHYNRDSWRASQVRNMGKVDGNSSFSDNDWEEVRYKSDAKIKEWLQICATNILLIMARNVFVSYKYADENVQNLFGHFPTKARHYVDEIEKLLAAEGHIFYGEHDGEDLSD